MPSSFTQNLPSDLIIDSAVLYFDRDTPYDPATPDDESMMVKFGGTRGGLQFNENAEWRSVPFDGASGENEGLHRKTDGVPTITGTTILLSPANLLALSPGSTSEVAGTPPNAKMVVTPLPYCTMLQTTDYHRWRCIWKRGSGGTFAVVFPRGLGLLDTIGAEDNNEGEIPITIRAVNAQDDIEDTDEVPAPFFYEYTGGDIDGAGTGTGTGS